MMPTCGCCGACVVFSDNFNRDDETINGLDSTTNWTCVPDLSSLDPDGIAWEINKTSSSPTVQGHLRTRHVDASGNPVGAGVPYTYFRAVCEQVVPRHFSCSVDVACDSEESIVNVTYQAIVPAEDEPGSKRYKVRLQWSPTPYGEEGGDTDCGYISLWDVTDLLSPVQLGWDVPVAGLSAGFVHRVTLCYDPETQLLSAHVKTDITGVGELGSVTHYIHAKNCGSASDTLDLSQIWLQVEDFGSLVDAGALDHQVVWDNFQISQTKNLANTGYYYYGDADDPNCPCCGKGGCSVVSDDFEDGVIDCRWYQSAGSWTESGGKISASSSTPKLTWLGSWSGINDDCEPDCSVKVTTLVKTPLYGITWTWFIRLDMLDNNNFHYATLTLANIGDNVSGSMHIYRVEGGTATQLGDGVTFSGLDPDVDVTFTACMLYDELTATVAGGSVSESLSETVGGYGGGAFCGAYVQLGTSSADTPFYNFEVSHNLDSPDCPDCFGDGSHTYLEGDCDDPDIHACADGQYPLAVRVKLTVVPGMEAVCADTCTALSGSYILPIVPDGCDFYPGPLSVPSNCSHSEPESLTFSEDDFCTCLWRQCITIGDCPEWVGFPVGKLTIQVALYKLATGGYGVYGILEIAENTCESGLDGSLIEGAVFVSDAINGLSQVDCLGDWSVTVDALCFRDLGADENDSYLCRFHFGGGTIQMEVSSI